MNKKKYSVKLYFPIWFSTLIILCFVFILLWFLIVQWYEKSEIQKMRRDLEQTTVELASFSGADIEEFHKYLQYVSTLYSNNIKSVFVQEDNKIIDYKTGFPVLMNIDTRAILSLEGNQIYSASHSGNYYCLAKTNYIVEQKKLFLFNSCNESLIVSSRVSIQENLFFAMLAAFFFSIVITYIFTRYLTRPISMLAKKVKNIGNDNLEFDFKSSSIEEINVLQDSFVEANRHLMEAEKMEKEFISGVAHELRTPITIIQSYTEMIRDLSGEDKSTRERDLEVILQQTKILSKHISDMILISKVQSNVYDEKSLINISEEVSSMIENFMPLLREKNIQVKVEIEPNVCCEINGLCLKYCLTNFFTNAIKYTRDEIQISLYKRKNRIYYEVLDNGKGFNPENKDLIWSRFYREAVNDTEEQGSAGMGLAIVKSICEHAGYEYGCSREEYITKFYIILGE